MKNVLIIDSGLGGVNVLIECVKRCPYCNFLLFCDSKNLPYGNKTNEHLWEITCENLLDIKSYFDYDIVIFGCNTLTATVIGKARSKFADTIFIGTEPAVKVALCDFSEDEILVVATESTIKNSKLLNSYPKIHKLALCDFAKLIDQNVDDFDVLDNYILTNIPKGYKAVVLGCTHYFAVAKKIEKLIGVKTFESASGVANRLLSFVSDDILCKNYQVKILSNVEADISKFWWYFQNNI